MPRILIIDDDESIRHLLREALTLHGYEVVEASNGLEGLRLHRAQPADLLITDILMPERDGLECILQLRKSDPGLRILAMSGGSLRFDLDVLALAKSFGARRTFAKPFDLRELLAAVQEGLCSGA